MVDMKTSAAQHGFDLISSEELPEIEGFAHVMRHAASGARLLYLQNDDANKAFSITFKTPAADDTGVFHILEHSVLCGSKRFPVKEPFVNLLKTSMQTFLNAMTFPDKTMYPVASTNERDLMNLMDVYLNAVFYPAIYQKPEIFEQEGWHLETVSAEGESHPQVVYNGVVYNEMKGALSDPNSVLYDTLSAALFPDTTYRFESGGTPQAIPTLTREAFLDNHRRHYRPDNSYIILYGDLDLDKFLAFIADEYLEPLAKEGSQAGTPNALDLQTPVVNEHAVHLMQTAPENACCAEGFVIGQASERTRMIAVDILLEAIMGSNESPLKRALLDAGVAEDASAYIADAMYQPFATIQLKGISEGAASVLKEVVAREMERLAAGGLDHELLEAALSRAEFLMRERNFSYPDGVILSMSVMSGWLYGDEHPCAYLRYEDAFKFLRANMDKGYFEQLCREVFLENDHWACAEVIPAEETSEEALEEEALGAAFTAEDFERIDQETARLRAAQETPDAPEDLATLPQLHRSDIGPAAAEPACSWIDETPLPCLRHSVATHGIAYVYRYYALSSVAFDDLPYVSILSLVLGKLDTQQHTAAQIDTLVQRYLGNMGFFTEVHEKARSSDDLLLQFAVSSSALAENASYLATLPDEVITATNFNDPSKIRDILTQCRLGMEQGFANAGHTSAMRRVTSYYLPAGVVREKMNGVDFYFFLKDLLENFDERVDGLVTKLEDLASRIFKDDNCVISYAGTDACLDVFWKERKVLAGQKDQGQLVIPEPQDRHEAFVVPADVSYTALGYDRRLLDVPYTGSWLLACRILSYDYLWNEVRVKGGAYGAGFQTTRTGSSRFYSFRDPHIDETISRYEKAGGWLKGFEPSKDELDGYVVSTVASLDAPVKPRELIRRQDGMIFAGYDLAARMETRQEVIDATADDVRAVGASVKEIADKHLVCTFGSQEIIDSSAQDYKVIDLLKA